MNGKRIAAGAALAAAATGAVLAGGITPASATSQANGWVAAGGQLCVFQNAEYQVRGEGNADAPGVVFRLRKTGGSTVAVSNGPVTGTWNGEGRTSLGTFPEGSGQYQVCANNNGATSVYVNLVKILSDSELPN